MTKRVFASLLFSVLATTAVACGSEDPLPTREPEQVVFREDSTFGIDDFLEAGFEDSEELSATNLPIASSIWSGTYKGRDVEVRFYELHEHAAGPGVNSAKAIVDANKVGEGTATPEVSGFTQYVVAGNAVILCDDAELCLELARSIPSGA